MEKNKLISFIKALTQKTISHSQNWRFASSDHILQSISGIDENYSYTTETKQGIIYIASDGYNASSYTLLIKPKAGPLYDSSELISWNNNELRKEYDLALKDLYQAVYSSLPNPDSFIDDFLNQ